MSSSRLLVACLCAEWCGTCREYRAVFERLTLEFPHVRFSWVDVEDDHDAVADVDVEDFPTLLIARVSDGTVDLRFAGTLLPHAGHLRRLLQTSEQACGDSPLPPLSLAPAQADAYRALALHLAAQPAGSASAENRG